MDPERYSSEPPLSPPFQPMPLRIDKIGAILTVRIGYNALAIERCSTVNGNPFGFNCPEGAVV